MNEFPMQDPSSVQSRFVEQLKDPLIIVLLVAVPAAILPVLWPFPSPTFLSLPVHRCCSCRPASRSERLWMDRYSCRC